MLIMLNFLLESQKLLYQIDVKLLNAITNINAERIVYVSCDPSTLARDLAILEKNGYKTIEVQPVDMFPQTTHIENVAMIVKL